MSVVAVHDGRLWLGDRSLPLVSGEVQFWRMDPAAWRPALEAVADLGVPIVSTYLSWRRHAPTCGAVDLTGRTDPRLDVPGFLRHCAELDLVVQLKPGPWICAEEPGGGYPAWLLAQRDILALDHAGAPVIGYNTPFRHPVPSYHDPRYLAQVRQWFATVWRELAEFRYPYGPIALVQLDNEPSVCFQDTFRGFDYHPEALASYRTWLDGRAGGDADWIAFQEWSLGHYLRVLRDMHADLGAGSLLCTVNLNTHPTHDVPQSHAAIRRQTGAATGEDHYYIPPLDLTALSRLARSAATARAAGEPLVWAPELQAGIWRSPGEVVTYPDPTPVEQEAWWGATLAFGFQGFNFYMLVLRENWEFAPLGPAGQVREGAASVRRLVALLREHPVLTTTRPETRVAVAWHRPDAYAAYADPARGDAYREWERVLHDLLAAGYPYELWDTGSDQLPEGVDVLVIPQGSGAPKPGGVAIVTADDVADVLAARGIRPAARLAAPDSLVMLHRAGDRAYLHIVHYGQDTAGSALTAPGLADGWLDDLATGRRWRIESGTARLIIRPGHAVLRWAQSQTPQGVPRDLVS